MADNNNNEDQKPRFVPKVPAARRKRAQPAATKSSLLAQRSAYLEKDKAASALGVGAPSSSHHHHQQGHGGPGRGPSYAGSGGVDGAAAPASTGAHKVQGFSGTILSGAVPTGGRKVGALVARAGSSGMAGNLAVEDDDKRVKNLKKENLKLENMGGPGNEFTDIIKEDEDQWDPMNAIPKSYQPVFLDKTEDMATLLTKMDIYPASRPKTESPLDPLTKMAAKPFLVQLPSTLPSMPDFFPPNDKLSELDDEHKEMLLNGSGINLRHDIRNLHFPEDGNRGPKTTGGGDHHPQDDVYKKQGKGDIGARSPSKPRQLGKFRVHESGRISLALAGAAGEIKMDMLDGSAFKFLQHLVLVQGHGTAAKSKPAGVSKPKSEVVLDEKAYIAKEEALPVIVDVPDQNLVGPAIIDLGTIEQKFIVVPDL